MFDQLIHLAKRIWDRLAKAVHQLFRRVTQPALSNPLTGTLADLPRSRAQLLAENAFLRHCAGYPFRTSAFLASTGLGGSLTVIVVQPVQHRERHHLPCLSLSRR